MQTVYLSKHHGAYGAKEVAITKILNSDLRLMASKYEAEKLLNELT